MGKNRNKQYGLGYERKEKKFLEEQGYTANRNRGSDIGRFI